MIKLIIGSVAFAGLLVSAFLVGSAEAQALREITILRTSDMELVVVVDMADTKFIEGDERIDANLVGRVVSANFTKRSDEPWLVTLFQNGEERFTFDTEIYNKDSRVNFPSFLDRTLYLDSITFRSARKYPYPQRPRSVGAGTADAQAADGSPNVSVTTGTFTPSNPLIVVSTGAAGNPVGDIVSISDTFSDTLSCTLHRNEASSTRSRILVHVCTGWSTGSGTITVELDAGSNFVIHVDTYAGVDSTPVSENAGANGTDATLSFSLTGVTSENRSHAAVASRGDLDGITNGTDETELADTNGGGGGNSLGVQTQHGDNDGLDADIDWADLAENNNAGGAIELAASGAAAARRVILVE